MIFFVLFCYLVLACICFYMMSKRLEAEAKVRIAALTIDSLNNTIDGDKLAAEEAIRDVANHLEATAKQLEFVKAERDAYFYLSKELFEAYEDQRGGDATLVNRLQRRAKAMQDARILLGRPLQSKTGITH